MIITFRAVDMSDMPRLTAWLMEPHVRKFYQPAPNTLAEVAAEYAPMIGNDTPTICHLAVSAGMPFAYVQSYRNLDYPEWAEVIGVRDGISVDLFIGEPTFLHRGFGRAMLRAYLNQVALAHFAAETRAYIAHAMANAPALRCSQAAGFRPLREFMECGVPTLLLVREAGSAGVPPPPPLPSPASGGG
jgi:aminoglycoside 6'-N-acetyltransferase